MLDGIRVLIVEDEALIAMELSDIVEDSCGRVVGPFRSNRDALKVLESEQIDAAIIDLNLADGDATSITGRLVEANIPILVCTAGTLSRDMRRLWPDLPIHHKPVRPGRLIEDLSALCHVTA